MNRWEHFFYNASVFISLFFLLISYLKYFTNERKENLSPFAGIALYEDVLFL